MILEVFDYVGDRFIPISRQRLGASWWRFIQKFPTALEKLSWAENLMVA